MDKKDIIDKQNKYLFSCVATYYDEPLVIDHAKDHSVFDADGKEYLDFFGGILTVSVGHCNDKVTQAIYEQTHKVQHMSTLYANEPQVLLAEKLAQITPGRLEKAVALRAERQRRGSDCTLLDCLQVKDKADILVGDGASLAILGVHSRREADRLTRDIEKLRNHLAHAQELETGHLATAARLASFIHSIVRAEGAQRIVALRREVPAPASPVSPCRDRTRRTPLAQSTCRRTRRHRLRGTPCA